MNDESFNLFRLQPPPKTKSGRTSVKGFAAMKDRPGVRPPILRFDPREQGSQAKNRKIGGLTSILVFANLTSMLRMIAVFV
jgi:hypothetical protein